MGANVQVGRLNPAWVESLMGFPAGWTELDPEAPGLILQVRKQTGKSRARSFRADRLRCLGNAVVPQCATLIGLAINEEEAR